MHMALFGLAEAERGQNLIKDSAEHYAQSQASAAQQGANSWITKRAALNAGEMYDLLGQRDEAIKHYQVAAASGGDQSQADDARKYLKKPYTVK